MGIIDRVLQCQFNHTEREGYAALLEPQNLENNLHSTVDDTQLQNNGILSGCLYTDTDNTRQHPTTKLVSAIANHHQLLSQIPRSSLPTLTYQTRGHLMPLNDWDDSTFFTVAFSMLFPFGIGGHIPTAEQKRAVPISLQNWASWTLSHHSRR